jgi:hypothetical protein
MGSVPVLAQNETVAATPTCGKPGDSFQLTGSGWGTGTVSLTFGPAYAADSVPSPPPGTVALTSATTKSDGTFTVNEQVPTIAFSFNAYQITAKQTIGEFPVVAITGFLVPCKTLTVDPTCGSVRGVVTVTGTGFQPRNPVAITFEPPAGGKPLTSALPAADSTFRVAISVPSEPNGIYAVVATQNYVAAALVIPPLILRAEFTVPCVKGSIKLTPRVGPPGTVVTVTGSGFPVGAVVKLSWNRGVPFKLATITIGASQGFQVKLLIFPHDELGRRTLSAGPDLSVSNAIIFNIATADFLVVPGSEQPRDFSWRR